MRWRRVARDYEERCDVSEAMIGLAMSNLMLRRIAHQQQFSNGHLERGTLPDFPLILIFVFGGIYTARGQIKLPTECIAQFAHLTLLTGLQSLR